MKRNMALGAVLLALGAGGTALSQKAAAGGAAVRQREAGPPRTPAVIQPNAQPGPLATMTVANRSTAPLAITITPRPWTQDAAGKVSPNRRGPLAGGSGPPAKGTRGPRRT